MVKWSPIWDTCAGEWQRVHQQRSVPAIWPLICILSSPRKSNGWKTTSCSSWFSLLTFVQCWILGADAQKQYLLSQATAVTGCSRWIGESFEVSRTHGIKKWKHTSDHLLEGSWRRKTFSWCLAQLSIRQWQWLMHRGRFVGVEFFQRTWRQFQTMLMIQVPYYYWTPIAASSC